MSAEQYTLKDYIHAFRRRATVFFTTLGLILSLAIAGAVIPVDQYRAAAEMRIDLAGPNIDVLEPVILTNYADQYVQTLEQKVMTRDNLESWLNQSNAYDYLPDDLSDSEKIRLLQEDIAVQMVFTTVIDEQSGKEVDLITGFRTVFVGREPQVAEYLANSAANAFLAEDRKTRIAAATAARSFLTEQIESKRKEITDIEAKIATFKEENAGKLPDLMVLNMTALERAERELESTQREIRNLQQDLFFREAQLEEIEQRVGGSASQLAALEAEYNRAIALYGAGHPDVIRIRRQVASLTSAESRSQSPQIAQLEAELAAARDRYTDAHPDVLRLQRQIKEMKANESPSTDGNLDDPLYLQLRAQINAINSNLNGLRNRAEELRSTQEDLQEKISSMPQVERRYQVLQRDLQTATLAFDNLRDRLAQAQQIESFESGERGARLTLVRSASAPQQPSGPPRIAILVIGVILAGTLASAAAVITEMSDNTVRGSKDVLTVMHAPAIAMVPVVQNSVSIAKRRRTQAVGLVGLLMIAGTTYFYFFWLAG